MKIILSFFSISFFLSIIISCNESRENKLLVIYQEDGPYSKLKNECIQIIQESSYEREDDHLPRILRRDLTQQFGTKAPEKL